MLIAIILIAAGFAMLIYGGDLLLKGAVSLANILKLTPAVIGLTVVAAATSVPELAVSMLASIQGQPDIAVGNVVGSNVLNIALILGITAIIQPLKIGGNTIRLEYPVMALTTLLCAIFAHDLQIDRLEALFFLAAFVIFTAFMVSLVREQLTKTETEDFAAEAREKELASEPASKIAAYVVAGILLLGIGANLAVEGAVQIAAIFGVSERVIGLTIVAFGTSLPEIVTSIVAALKKREDVAVANIIGSNIFNILAILGLSGLILPLQVSNDIAVFDNWWMLGVALLLFPIMFTRREIVRKEGALLLAVYAVYLASLLSS